jgi:hypothetical protein
MMQTGVLVALMKLPQPIHVCGVCQILDHPRTQFSRCQSACTIYRPLEGRVHPHDTLTQVLNKCPLDWTLWESGNESLPLIPFNRLQYKRTWLSLKRPHSNPFSRRRKLDTWKKELPGSDLEHT